MVRSRQASAVAMALVVTLILSSCGSAPETASPAATPLPPAGSQGNVSNGSANAGLPPLTDVPFYRVDTLGLLLEPGPGPAGKPELAWQVDIGPTHWAPLLVGGLVVAGTSAGLLIALDARSGAERWRFQADHAFSTGSFNGSAAAADGLVFVCDISTVYAVDASTGVERWRAPVPTKGSRPAVVDGVVYVGTIGGAVGFAEATGKAVWQWAGPQGIAMTAGPVVDGVAYLSSRGDGRLYAVNLSDGSERWNVATIAVAVGSSEVVGDTVFVGTNQAGASEPVGRVYAIDRVSGKPRWQFGGPLGGQLVAGPVRDGVIYLSSETDGIWAMRDDRSQATKVFHVDAPPSVLPLSMFGDTLYEQRTDGSIGAYAVSDGKLLWETAATGDDGGGPPLVSGGMIFEVGDVHGVRAYADPALVASLPSASPAPVPSASPSPSQPPDPFSIVRSFSWASITVATPLGMDAGPDGLLYILDTKPSVTVIDPKDGRVVHTWGRQGTGQGDFDLTVKDDNPGIGDIAVAADNKVYVADGSNARVQVFSPDGKYMSQFGSFGTGDGQFGSVSEIATSPDGSIYVLDGDTNQISKFTPDRKFVWRSPAPGPDPEVDSWVHGIAVRTDKSLLATCERCGELLVLDPADGHIRGRLAEPQLDGDRFGLLTLDREGNVYVAVFGSNSQLVFDATAEFIGGQYHQAGMPFTSINRQVSWGDTLWPSPVFLPNGRGFTFGKDGLTEVKVSLPAK
jgi:outer membrane protein assembly factor BamB